MADVKRFDPEELIARIRREHDICANRLREEASRCASEVSAVAAAQAIVAESTMDSLLGKAEHFFVRDLTLGYEPIYPAVGIGHRQHPMHGHEGNYGQGELPTPKRYRVILAFIPLDDAKGTDAE